MKGLIQEIQYLPNRTSRGGKRKYMKWIKTPTEENYPEDMNFQTEKVHQVLKTMEWNRDPSQGTLSWHVRTQGIKRQFLKSFRSRDRTHKKVWIRMHIRYAKKKNLMCTIISASYWRKCSVNTREKQKKPRIQGRGLGAPMQKKTTALFSHWLQEKQQNYTSKNGILDGLDVNTYVVIIKWALCI